MTPEQNRIDTLSELIEGYQESYYRGEGEITDTEFDLLWDELRSLSPDHPLLSRVGSTHGVDGFAKARHLIPMGSQDKAANPEELRAWVVKVRAQSYLVQFKLDGASLELQYEKGSLRMAVTRGDGTTGDNITPNALRMKGVLPKLSEDFNGGVRGEVIMRRGVWEAKYTEKANCRNAANGIMRRKDGLGCEDLEFISYDAAALGDDHFFANEAEKITWLEKQGFTVSETRQFFTAEEIIQYREEIFSKRSDMDVEIDGLVVKDIVTDMTDLRRARPERQIAFKFEPEAAYSILKEVIWSESGATYTPIGIIEPVRLAGTTVKRANLNNPGMIRTLNLKIGAAVKVVKRGDIIPKIEGLAPPELFAEAQELKDISIPDQCNICGSTLVDEGTRLLCPNMSCPKKLHHRLEKWVSVLDIRELGDKLLRQLFDARRVRHISDLYTLEETELAEFERMGELSASKVIRHIRTKRELSLAAFVAGFNLEGVGELIMEKALGAGFDTLEALRAATTSDLAQVHGLGDITAETIVLGLKECAQEMDQVLSTGIISIAAPPSALDVPLKGVSFCFSGELKGMKRSQAEEKVKSLGALVKSSIVKDLSFLVSNESGSQTSKVKKAQALGVKIINEDEFLDMLKAMPQASPQAAPQKQLTQIDLF